MRYLARGANNVTVNKLALLLLSLALWMGTASAFGQVLQARVWIEGMT